uniref:Death domain-containing protein n=1 Tax=Amphimedon queenslandica TaxID=400682 RepID=A0A1X7T146_AMPQE
MIDLCQWRARIGSWNCTRHWRQPSACTSTGNIYCRAGVVSRAGDAAQEKGPRLVLSIFCLLILLFISGDVELNPGPTLTDKPTKDELVELLSSSKFTAGTWEQFVCCLPNMTQDIIAGIKERESIEEDTMSAVAQHCLDNNPDITWKRVINALLDADEAAVARNVLDNHSGTSSSKNVCRTVKQVLRSHYSKLMESTETCLLKVASELYSKNLINKEVRHSPTFDKIEIDFSAMVSLHKGDAKKMMEVCSLFIDCLSTAGGPAQEEAIALARDWENEVFKDHQVSFSTFTKTATEYTPQEVKLSFNDSLAVELRNLSKKYVMLIDDITKYYASSGKHEAIDLARWVQNTFYETGLARVGVTVDEVFERMLPCHSFIDINAMNDLMEANPIDDSVLQARFDEYSDNIDKFIDSVELNDIVKTIDAAIIGESTKVDPKKQNMLQ